MQRTAECLHLQALGRDRDREAGRGEEYPVAFVEPVETVVPPVVAVMVVHEPGPWFDEVLVAVGDLEGLVVPARSNR